MITPKKPTFYQILSASLVTGFFYATSVLAEVTPLKVNLISPFSSGNETVTTVDSFTAYFTKAIPLIFGFAAVMAVVQLVVGGVQYAISGLNPGQLSDATDRMQKALYGLGLALVSYVLLSTLDPRLVDLNLGIQQLGGTQTQQESGTRQTHRECQGGNACVVVSGPGEDNCTQCGGNDLPSGSLPANGTNVFCKRPNGRCENLTKTLCAIGGGREMGILCAAVHDPSWDCTEGGAVTHCQGR